MVKSRLFISAVVAALLILLAASQVPTVADQIASSRDLLRAVREKQGRVSKPAYEDRGKENPKAPNEESPTEKRPLGEAQTNPQMNQAGDELLRIIPAGCLFCVRVNNLDYTAGQVDQFLAGVSPVPMGLSMLMRTHLAGLLGSPQLTGLNMAGSFAIFAIPKSTGAAPPGPIPELFIAALVPVTDYEQFIGGNPNVGEPDEKGISRITSEGMPPILASQLGSFALISPAEYYDDLLRYKEMMGLGMAAEAQTAPLAAALDAELAEQALTGPIWAYADMQQVSRTFTPLVLGGLEAAKMQMKNMPASQQPGGAEAMAMKVMDMYAGIAQVFMKETKSVSLTLEPSPDAFRLALSIAALPSTNMADIFTAGDASTGENDLLAYLEDGAAMNLVANLNCPLWKKIYAASIDWMAAFAGENMNAEAAAQMKALVERGLDSLAGPIAESVTISPQTKPPFAVTYVLRVKDPAEYRKLIEDSAKLWNTAGLADFYKALGMQTNFNVKLEAEHYKGVSIDAGMFAIKPTDMNSPQAQMIAAMYGDGFDYRWAIVDGLCVGASGGEASSAVRKLIDQAKTGGPKQMPAEIKAASELLPTAQKADLMFTFNILRMFKMVAAFAPVPLPQMEFQSKSNMVFAGKAADGKLRIDMALPKEHLAEIMTAVQTMKPQKVPQPPQTTAPAPELIETAQQIVKGRIRGTEVTLDNAELSNNSLAIYAGDSWGSNPSVILFIFDIKDGAIPDNKSFSREPKSDPGAPTVHVHYRWKDPESGDIKTEVHTRDYHLELRFGRHKDKTIPGAILLEIPDKDTHLEGNFNAKIKDAAAESSNDISSRITSAKAGPADDSERFGAFDDIRFQNKHGPAKTVELKITGVTDDMAEEALAVQLKAMTGARKNWLSYQMQDKTMLAEVAPVTDVKAFARKIRFGTVTGITERQIAVRMRKTVR